MKVNPLLTEEGKKFVKETRSRRDMSVKEKQELIKQFCDNYEKEPVAEPVSEPEPVAEPVVVPTQIDDDIGY